QPSGRYACLWLDSTGGGGLSPQAIGYALPDDDVLAFVFDGGEAGSFHTTFIYDREEDTWRWTMDIVNGEESQAFARVKLARR
ncbi:MAG TPA: hypothetical protein VLA34_05590, partial [Candidatus Krumholzibacterium sp.]|nr:hypothetical protein [Candidatus Krumholzibacterium sp.]